MLSLASSHYVTQKYVKSLSIEEIKMKWVKFTHWKLIINYKVYMNLGSADENGTVEGSSSAW